VAPRVSHEELTFNLYILDDIKISPGTACVCSCIELVYAAESYKKIIPLTLEPRYNPHGWLRFHTSDGLRYDFSNNESFEDSFSRLVRVLKKCYSSSGTVGLSVLARGPSVCRLQNTKHVATYSDRSAVPGDSWALVTRLAVRTHS